MNIYKDKYIKYKKKYLKLKKQFGGLVNKPDNLCCLNVKKIVKAHGIIDNTFVLPKGASFITLTNVNEICPMHFEFDKEFKYFYENKYTLFEKNDKSTIKTKDGIGLENYLTNKFKIKFNFKNHIGDGETEFNDMILDFHHNCSDFACSIQCIDRKEVCNPTTIKSGVSKRISKIRLSELINKEGFDTYIIIACRSLLKDLPKNIPQLHRSISDEYQKKMKEKEVEK